MNIWILNHYAVPTRYYYLARSYYFAKKLMERGHRVTIFAGSSVHNSDINLIEDGREYRELEDDGIRYVVFRGRTYAGSGKDRIINHIEVARRMERLCPRLTGEYGRPDVIYASAGQTLTLVAGIRVARRLGIPCVCEVTDLWPESFVAYGMISRKNPLLRLLYRGERWVYKNADALIFSMEGGRDYIIEKGWDTAHGGCVDLGKISYINNGVDLARFDEQAAQTPDDAYITDPDTFKIVYAGSIRRVNDIHALLDSAAVLREKAPQCRILIYGDGDEREAFEREYAGFDNIRFMGRVPKSAIPAILTRADVCFIDGCEGDGAEIARFGMSQNKIFEYLAAGRPIVFPVPGRYDLIGAHGCGFTVENEPEAVTEALLTLAQSPSLCGQMGGAARRLAQEFDFNALTDKLCAVFERVREKHGRG